MAKRGRATREEALDFLMDYVRVALEDDLAAVLKRGAWRRQLRRILATRAAGSSKRGARG